jgi:hypothetical protein
MKRQQKEHNRNYLISAEKISRSSSYCKPHRREQDKPELSDLYAVFLAERRHWVFVPYCIGQTQRILRRRKHPMSKDNRGLRSKTVDGENTEKISRYYLVYFSMLHLLVWLAACFLFGWLGIIFGFLVNFVLDMGLLLIWMCGIAYKRHFLSGISGTIRWYRN